MTASEITALKPSSHYADRIHVYLDGEFLASVDEMTVAARHLRVGMQLSPADAASLREEADVHALVDRCLRFLSFRPRSEQELRLYLQRRKVEPEQVEAVMEELRRLKLVDDAAFARFWRDSRDRFSPRGERLLKAELRAKGLSSEDVAEALPEPEDEAALALRAAERHVRTLRGLPWPDFRQKMLGFLQRRGFDYDLSNRVARAVWDMVAGEEQREAREPLT